MIPTVIGALTLLAGLGLLLLGSVPAMLAYVTVTSLMGGAAAVLLVALGGSSVPPMQVAIGFLALRVLLPGGGQVARLGRALRDNLLLAVFVGYGVVMAFVGPRLFAHQINVVPMRFSKLHWLLQTWPLEPSSQNATTAVYLAGTLLAAVGAHVAGQDRRTPHLFVKAGLGVAWAHVAFGIYGALTRDRPAGLLIEFFRNGNYAQADQTFGSYARIAGIMPEPSSYALFAFAWLVFHVECWWRDVQPRRTGPTALALAVILAASTSSTAYVGLLAYAAVLGLRFVAAPRSLGRGKALALGALLLAIVTATLAAFAVAPGRLADLLAALNELTLAKGGSESGVQRAFWAYKGVEAFRVSNGLGIGPGSFRSSSLFTAILGSVGVVGIAAFLGYLVRVLRPLRRSTYLPGMAAEEGIGVAAGWAAAMMVVPAAFLSATPDPGATFAIFAGLALATRSTRPA